MWKVLHSGLCKIYLHSHHPVLGWWLVREVAGIALRKRNKEKVDMSPIVKSVGPFDFSLSDLGNGLFAAKVSLNSSIGGGSAAGVVKVVGSLEADLNAEQVAALGFAEFNKIIPAAILPAVEAGEALAEAGIAKL